MALWRDGATLVRGSPAAAAHSEVVLPFVVELLREAALRLRDLDAIAFGAGPGGFAGLRLACSVAQGLAYGAALPVIGVGSLEALAWATGAERVYACVDARMDEVYCACYVRSDEAMTAIVPPAAFAAHRAPLPAGTAWLGAGNGFATYPEILKTRLREKLSEVVLAAAPHAGAVAELAVRRFRHGERGDPSAAIPLYGREKVALTTAERLARGGKA